MKPHWPRVRIVFETLGYLVKRHDPDGIEICFTNCTVSDRHRDRERLLDLFDNVPLRRHDSIQVPLAKILERCTKGNTRSSIFNRKKQWGVSIYVLTDGNWSGDDDSLCGIPGLIKKTVDNLMSRCKLGIQFIQFGNDPVGTKRLERLDDGLKEHGVYM